MRTWDEAIKNGLRAYTQRDRYAYFYGAKGQTLTDAAMNALWNAEPGYFSRYSAAEKAQIFNNSRGKMGYDCSGFTGWICTGDKQYSTGQIGNCSKIVQDTAKGVAGSLLYKNSTGRHIGLDIGYGYCLDIAAESTDANVASGNASIRLRKISEGGWEKSGQSKLIDYAGADAR